VTLKVFTARLSRSLRDPDLLDVTRSTADRARRASRRSLGEPFAPSWKILGPALQGRERATALLRRAREIDQAHLGAARQPSLFAGEMNEAALEVATRLTVEAEDIEATLWAWYAPRFVDEMRKSYRAHRAAWDALLARPRVVLACTCTDPAHCHRALLAGILGQLGAEICGELAAPPTMAHAS